MPPKKKLSKKEKARLEAEQAELLRIEMEKERQRKLEEERQRRQIEYEQAKRRKKQEIQENKKRRAQLKGSMEFFRQVRAVTGAIKTRELEQRDWEKYMRCNGLPNANSPSDLRRYIHQWRCDMEQRERESRNWLLNTNERTLLTQDLSAVDLSRNSLRQRQGEAGDVYAQRMREVLGVLTELDEALVARKSKPSHIIADLSNLKMEMRAMLSAHLDEFSYKIMSHIERDMNIDRPGVCKHIYESAVFKSHLWTFSKDAQISVTPKARIGEQNTSNDIDFPALTLQVALPLSVELRSSALRGLWLNYDHFSDYCPSYSAKRQLPEYINILRYTKREWRKRKEILDNMLEDCTKDSPISTGTADQDSSSAAATKRERSFDVDKLYAEYEDELNKARRRAMGPQAFGLTETDVNLRKYRIIGGVYCVDYLDIPQQDKRINARSFICTIVAPDRISHKSFFQSYKPPPPPQPGVRRLPEEIEAEMRMVEAALDKLALVSLHLPDSVIWFEPPIICRWESHFETLESNLSDGVKPNAGATATTTATPTEATPLSTTANTSPLKGSPRFPARLRKRSSQKSAVSADATDACAVREVNDFDLFDMPSNIDVYGMWQDFVVPRLPPGFCVRWEKTTPVLSTKVMARRRRKQYKKQQREGKQRCIFLARHKSVNPTAERALEAGSPVERLYVQREEYIDEQFLDNDEPREFFPQNVRKKAIKFREHRELEEAEQKPYKQSATKSTSMYAGSAEVEECKQEYGRSNVDGNGGNNGNVDGANDSGSGSGSNKTSLSCSRRSSKESPPQLLAAAAITHAEPAARKTYMFSKLLEDLEHLCELQRPLQLEALKRISTDLSATSANPNADANDSGVADAHVPDAAAANEDPEPMTPAFSYYASFAFLRDLEAKNGNTDNKNEEAAQRDSDDDDEASSSSDEREADEDYNDFDNFGEEQVEEEEQAVALNLNSLVSDLNAAAGAGGASGAASSGLQLQFLSKQHQSETDNGDGKTDKSSNQSALMHGKWSTRDVHDTKFNEEKLSIQFRTGRLGLFGLALNRYSNMPYQTWEIKPDFKSPGAIFFSFTASIISLDMHITAAGYCMNNFQGGSTDAINEILGKVLTLAELKSILIAAAVDIFPDADTFCYTEGTCEKNYVMEMHLYACMSTLALSHNFSWSRWNLLAGSRTIVLLMRELIEGKKVPYHSTLLVTPLKTAIIDCTEVSPSFNSAGIAGMEYYADLYQLMQVYAQSSSLEKQRRMDPMLRENVARILMAIRPLSFC